MSFSIEGVSNEPKTRSTRRINWNFKGKDYGNAPGFADNNAFCAKTLKVPPNIFST